MIPKEKAKELFSKYYDEICNLIEVKNGKEQGERYKIIMPIAKKCALIAVNEILVYREEIDGMRVINDPYWLEVKKEINNL